MKLDIALISHAVYLDNGIMEVGAAVAVERSALDDSDRFSLRCRQTGGIKIMLAPEMTEQFFRNKMSSHEAIPLSHDRCTHMCTNTHDSVQWIVCGG